MKYGLLKQIIGLLEAFEQEQDSSKIEDFTIWLNHKLFDKNEPSNGMGHEDLLISFKIMMIQKDLKKRSKAVLSNSLISAASFAGESIKSKRVKTHSVLK